MYINIHRGQNQIGGSIIELATDSTRIILDVGINLDEGREVEIPKIEGLFCGDPTYDAVIISHYHSDHIGLLPYVLEEIPIYIGKQAYDIVQAAAEYTGKEVQFRHIEYKDGEKQTIGDLAITPYRCDHSAFDSYMFVITDGVKKVLYTGDFRANGRADYDALLEHLPEVDALIVEGTMLSRETYKNNITEQELEEIACDALKKYKGPAFLLSSAMNVDRITTGFNAARKTGRIFLEDLYTAGILNAIGGNLPSPGIEGVKVFMTGGDRQFEMLKRYSDCKIGKQGIARLDFLMCIRPSMKNYLRELNKLCSFDGGILFYSMWKGYQERRDMKEFLQYMESLGVKIHVLHTSGHADVETIDKLVNRVLPKMIIPVHTENPEWYEKYGTKIVLENNRITM